MQEKSWEIKEIPAWVSQKGASALRPELPQSNSGLFYITILHLFCDTKKRQTFSDEELANQYFLLVDN